MFDESYISKRIYQLRSFTNVSARDMSLSLGQNENYINQIENQKTLPSMQVFFYICDYFKISPLEFFSDEIENPTLIQNFMKDLNKLSNRQINNIYYIALLITRIFLISTISSNTTTQIIHQ